MHHHRLVLDGPPAAVAELTDALHAAGARPVPHADPPRLTWTTPAPSALHGVCSRHPRAVVNAERFALLGETLDRVVVRGAESTVLERRPFAPRAAARDLGDDIEDGDPVFHGLTLAGEIAPLDAGALGDAARRVAAQPPRLGPSPAAGALADALLVGAAVGRLCVAATADPSPCEAHALSADPRAAACPAPSVLDALAGLAAAAVTAGAACRDPAGADELAYERARHLTEAYAIAAAERLWSLPGDADWPEWLMYVMLGAVAVVDDCATTLHQPPPPLLAAHLEHAATQRDRLCHASTRLVATCLQALVLFAEGEC